MVSESCTECEESPAKTSDRQPDSWSDTLHDDVVGNLSKKVTTIEHRVNLIEIGGFEVKIFPHTTHISVIEIGSVEIVAPVHEADIGQDEEVDLQDESPFSFGIGRRAPDNLSDPA